MNYFPSALSFLLPGLGQLHQHRPRVAMLIFVCFTGIHFLPGSSWLTLLAAFVASAECYYREKKSERAKSPYAEKRRTLAYSATGLVGFLGWVSLASTSWLPVGVLLDTQDQADRLSRMVRRCQSRLGKFPSDWNECGEKELSQARDRWGNPFWYEVAGAGFLIRSSGRDGKLGTGDDYHFRYR